MVVRHKAAFILFFLYASSVLSEYSRGSFGFHSYKPTTSIGFYTNRLCQTEIDHVVSLEDAWISGAKDWSLDKRKIFANDKLNHVPACDYVNRSKRSSSPKDFIRKSEDGLGVEYKILNMCLYLNIYLTVKIKYALKLQSLKEELSQYGCKK